MVDTDSPCRKRSRARIRSCFCVSFIDGSSREVPSMLHPNLVFQKCCVKKLCTMSRHILLCMMSRHLSPTSLNTEKATPVLAEPREHPEEEAPAVAGPTEHQEGGISRIPASQCHSDGLAAHSPEDQTRTTGTGIYGVVDARRVHSLRLERKCPRCLLPRKYDREGREFCQPNRSTTKRACRWSPASPCYSTRKWLRGSD